MTENELKAYVCAIATTLVETGNPLAPASAIYMALGCNIDDYNATARCMLAIGLIRLTSETIQLTEKGIDFGNSLLGYEKMKKQKAHLN